MKRLAALLLLVLPTIVRGESAHRGATSPSPPFSEGARGGLQLVFETGRARLGVEAGDPLDRRLLASGFVETRESLRAMFDGIRRLAGAEEGAPRLVPPGPTAATGCPAVRVVGPRVVSVPVLLSLPLSGSLRGLLEPALDVGWTTSRLSLASVGTAHGDDASGPGYGFQLSAGLEMSLADAFGLSVKAGWRVLRAPAADRVAVAGALVSALPGAGGEADLGGAYGTLGAVLRI